MNRQEAHLLPLSAIDGQSSTYLGRPTLWKPTVKTATTTPALSSSLPTSSMTLPLPLELENRMFPHQREGVQWLYDLHHRELGGILGDDMGLGKTFQVSCLLCGLMRAGEAQRVLIVSPVSVLSSWQRELLEHLVPHVKRVTLELVTSEMVKKRRQKVLADVFSSRNCKIVVTSYQLLSNMVEDFAEKGSWDYVVLDEGHCIKNTTTKLYKAMQSLHSKHRLVLSGTFIQNKLDELWALVNWATDGSLLGTKPTFKKAFTDPIMAGQDPKATDKDRESSKQAAALMRRLVGRVILQRKKCEHQDVLKLTDKVEVVVWVPLSSSQRRMYERYLADRQVQQTLANAQQRKCFPVEVVNNLKTISRHPFLMEASDAVRSHTGKAVNISTDNFDVNFLADGLKSMSLAGGAASGKGAAKLRADANVFDIAGRKPELEELLRDSIKLRVLMKLTQRLKRAGHRVLVFSQSKRMLDLMQCLFAEYGLHTSRIDGSVVGRDRQAIIDSFNAGGSDGDGDEGMRSALTPSILLLTTKACGTGITLTGADRVIIFDPSWNPAEDRQAVDRAFRIGQKKDVVVYRLILASSIEERMYEKQVFKDGVRVVTESGTSSRYFSSLETKEDFTLGPVDNCLVMRRLWAAVGSEMRQFADTGGDLPKVLGYSRHDTLYEESRPEEVRNISRTKTAGAATPASMRKVDRVSDGEAEEAEEDGDEDEEGGIDKNRTTQGTMDGWLGNHCKGEHQAQGTGQDAVVQGALPKTGPFSSPSTDKVTTLKGTGAGTGRGREAFIDLTLDSPSPVAIRKGGGKGQRRIIDDDEDEDDDAAAPVAAGVASASFSPKQQGAHSENGDHCNGQDRSQDQDQDRSQGHKLYDESVPRQRPGTMSTAPEPDATSSSYPDHGYDNDNDDHEYAIEYGVDFENYYENYDQNNDCGNDEQHNSSAVCEHEEQDLRAAPIGSDTGYGSGDEGGEILGGGGVHALGVGGLSPLAASPSQGSRLSSLTMDTTSIGRDDAGAIRRGSVTPSSKPQQQRLSRDAHDTARGADTFEAATVSGFGDGVSPSFDQRRSTLSLSDPWLRHSDSAGAGQTAVAPDDSDADADADADKNEEADSADGDDDDQTQVADDGVASDNTARNDDDDDDCSSETLLHAQLPCDSTSGGSQDRGCQRADAAGGTTVDVSDCNLAHCVKSIAEPAGRTPSGSAAGDDDDDERSVSSHTETEIDSDENRDDDSDRDSDSDDEERDRAHIESSRRIRLSVASPFVGVRRKPRGRSSALPVPAFLSRSGSISPPQSMSMSSDDGDRAGKDTDMAADNNYDHGTAGFVIEADQVSAPPSPSMSMCVPSSPLGHGSSSRMDAGTPTTPTGDAPATDESLAIAHSAPPDDEGGVGGQGTQGRSDVADGASHPSSAIHVATPHSKRGFRVELLESDSEGYEEEEEEEEGGMGGAVRGPKAEAVVGVVFPADASDIIHVSTPHSKRGFCVDLEDSDNESENEGEGPDEGNLSAAPSMTPPLPPPPPAPMLLARAAEASPSPVLDHGYGPGCDMDAFECGVNGDGELAAAAACDQLWVALQPEEDDDNVSEAGGLTDDSAGKSDADDVDAEEEEEDEDYIWQPRITATVARRLRIIDSDDDNDDENDNGNVRHNNAKAPAAGGAGIKVADRSSISWRQPGSALTASRQPAVPRHSQDSGSAQVISLLSDSDDDEDEDERDDSDEESDSDGDLTVDCTTATAKEGTSSASFRKFETLQVALLPVTELSDDSDNDNGSSGNDSDDDLFGDGRRLQAQRDYTGPVDRPRRGLSRRQKEEYNDRVRTAQRAERRGDAKLALQRYVEALGMCDEDACLHGKMASLSQQLGYL